MAMGDPDTSGLDWNDATGWQYPWFREQRVFSPPPNYHTIRPGVYMRFEVPNRLYGATINREGDAV